MAPAQASPAPTAPIATPAHLFPPQKPKSFAAPAIANLTYHNGPVMHSAQTYAIYWKPTGDTHQLDSAYTGLIERFFKDLGGTPFNNINTQYADGTGPITNKVSFGGSWVDTNAFPHSGADLANGITETDVRQAVNDALAANPSWGPADLTKVFFVYTPKGVYGDSLGVDYCAYHNQFKDAGGQTALYAFEPYDATVTNCGSTTTTNGNFDADIELSTTSHELAETMTDPIPGQGWFNTNGAGENGDQCAYTYGTIYSDNSNVHLRGHPYIIQEEWSNADSGFTGTTGSQAKGCVPSYPNPPCTTNLTGDVTPVGPVASGEHWCITNARVEGPITVSAGGALTVTGSKVAKGITSTGASFLQICGTDIAKGLTVTGSTGFVTIGDAPECAANRLTGPGVTLDGNTAGFVFAGNTVASSVTITNNVAGTTTDGPNTVKGNKIYGSLACSANTPAPTNAETANTGAKAGQCTAL